MKSGMSCDGWSSIKNVLQSNASLERINEEYEGEEITDLSRDVTHLSFDTRMVHVFVDYQGL